ncbi:putative brefeldin A-inhibited guanine nucleotide-exchange protein 1 [Trypanosoma rangeli]|uniref:Putative brefeldin A-inhibited guanine nucleotide-exchange protein 1 n=1 Tax=Trypanosoma rangeli TaxID=5698 RepID=A0A3R7K5I5_TRYRA|nr:putative brefeldin A-inhibited guanine nucleotide-exchange protein 1 [Trypanosoma rangeli]RNF02049.1 putative brefeldin A-inhibited guanine nucleotide-exchange protein 1 [Trypanosoma rangeli]|eukprot:RNF02049.1 putative brefeldin A-inhibited guanine nucleotide-exchange protein 1 [Trypanosoma rangeli]
MCRIICCVFLWATFSLLLCVLFRGIFYTISEIVLQVAAGITLLCRGNHTLFRDVCLYSWGVPDKTCVADVTANLFVYPLENGSHVAYEEHVFLSLALDDIMCFLRLHLFAEHMVYDLTQVPLPEKKNKGIFTSTGATAPDGGEGEGHHSTTSPPRHQLHSSM